MSDKYVKVTDVDATIEEAEVLSQQIVDWLIEERIILPEKTDCVLGADLGYPPGPNVAQAVEYPERVYPLGTLGLEVTVGRNVQWTAEIIFRCPTCHRPMVDDDTPSAGLKGSVWEAALDDWEAGGAGMLMCNQCGSSSPISEYEQGDHPWGFGNLAFTFWNWTILKPDFLAEMSRRLGHRIVVGADKL